MNAPSLLPADGNLTHGGGWRLGHCSSQGLHRQVHRLTPHAVSDRKLAVLMHRLWVTGEEYEPLGTSTQGSNDLNICGRGREREERSE